MPLVPLSNVAIGSELPSFTTEPLSRLTLALYCGASGDHNPIHVDLDFARQAGMDDVFAHGMLSMAYLGRLLTNWVPQEQIRDFSVRFVAVTHLAESITCSAKVVEIDQTAGVVRLQISTCNQSGEIKLTGTATVALIA